MNEIVNESAIDRKSLLDQRTQELAEEFSFDGYQVVRKELFAHLRDPAVVIRRDSVTFNTACIEGLEDVVYIQILINPAAQKMVVRKCGEDDKDALRWCVAKPDKRKSRKISGKLFAAKIYRDMNWNVDYQYKILGYRITFDGETLYIFDFTETEVFFDRKEKKASAELTANADAGGIQGKTIIQEDAQEAAARMGEGHPRRSPRKGYLPEQWERSYGLPVEEHREALRVDIRDGYAQLDTFPTKNE